MILYKKENKLVNQIKKKRILNKNFIKINDIISSVTGVSSNAFTSDTLLTNLNNADALDVLEMIVRIEEELSFKIPDDNLFSSFKTIGDFYEHFRKFNVNMKYE